MLVNFKIAKIEGKLTTHVARHTFATLAGDKVPLQMLQKLYKHSDKRQDKKWTEQCLSG